MEYMLFGELEQTLASELMASLEARRVLKMQSRGSISIKTLKGRRYVYLQWKEGRKYKYKYLGPVGSVDVEQVKRTLSDAKKVAKSEEEKLKRLSKLLRRTGVVPISGDTERVLRALDHRGFLAGQLVLVGTLAFLAYQVPLGFVPAKGYRTLDIDVLRDRNIALASLSFLPLRAVLEESGFVFVPEAPVGVPFPVRLRLAGGLSIDVLTPKKGNKEFLPPPESGFSDMGATAMPYMDMLLEETFSGVLLCVRNSALLVTVPSPIRFVAHKLITAALRQEREPLKAQKDLYQAEVISKVLVERGYEKVADKIMSILGRWPMKKRVRESTLSIAEHMLLS